MKTGLVLGAGGTVGLAYHAGVLRALEQAGGFVPNDADVIVGTSAGSVAGAYLRAGWSTDDLYAIAMGTHVSIDGLSAEEVDARNRSIMQRNWRDPVTLARRAIGSAYVAGRSFVRVPSPLLRVPGALQRAFPGGLFANAEGRRRFAEELPVGWPERDLWLCAYDVDRSRRIVLGRPGRAPLANLQQAVLASCAIPGLYPPVRIGSMTLVDGGVWSTSNLDVAARAGCDLIIGVAPLAYDTVGPLPNPLMQLVRRVPARMLVNEMAEARSRGAEVLLIRPSAAEVRMHGANMMRRTGFDLVARAAYEATARALETERFRDALGGIAA
ncbi:MAG TPA: patatin-like phospholipase family protein [Acidimicrobiales bacterium]